ncbi:hypothetical protein JKP88DRAFT_253241 [Tribonema minus]|uniref:Uncharacterized protein n=1 Tax=Tribonema minus TaxID=303371 RepID=A0A835Z6Z4_9STRA|nr:hypothetical protein JKP88DRAFT_253241 [Tribonema minus]
MNKKKDLHNDEARLVEDKQGLRNQQQLVAKQVALIAAVLYSYLTRTAKYGIIHALSTTGIITDSLPPLRVRHALLDRHNVIERHNSGTIGGYVSNNNASASPPSQGSYGSINGTSTMPCTGPPAFSTLTDGMSRRAYHGVYTAREATCKRLLELLLMEHVVLIRPPPQSRKTSLLQLFHTYLQQLGDVRVVSVSLSRMTQQPHQFSFDQVLRPALHLPAAVDPITYMLEGKSYYHVYAPFRALRMDGCGSHATILLVDEAQMLYDQHRSGSAHFWRTLKYLQSIEHRPGGPLQQPEPKLRVVLAAAYGKQCSTDPNPDSLRLGPTGMVIPIRLEGRADVTVFGPPQLGGVSLRLDQDEWNEVWGRFTQKQELDSMVKDYIYQSCGGQVGLMMHCLDYLKSELANFKEAQGSQADACAMSMLMSGAFFTNLRQVRSFPSLDSIRAVPGDMELLRRLHWANFITVDLDAETTEARATRWLHVHSVVALGRAFRENCVRFTSPLHRLKFTRACYSSYPPADVSHDARALITRMLERMDPKVLAEFRSIGKNFKQRKRRRHMSEAVGGRKENKRACGGANPQAGASNSSAHKNSWRKISGAAAKAGLRKAVVNDANATLFSSPTNRACKLGGVTRRVMPSCAMRVVGKCSRPSCTTNASSAICRN